MQCNLLFHEDIFAISLPKSNQADAKSLIVRGRRSFYPKIIINIKIRIESDLPMYQSSDKSNLICIESVSHEYYLMKVY